MKSGWQTSTLGEVLAVIRNGVNCKQDKSGNGDRISRIESISDATFDLDKVGYAELSERDKEKNRLQPGDILFSHINSAVHVGKTAVFDCNEPVYHGVNLLLMRPKEVVTSAYLDHALKYLFQSGYWRGVCKQSVNQASVNQQDISHVEVHYPKSLAEQHRIVTILDEAFAGIATAKANAEKNLQNAHAIFESHLNGEHAEKALLGDLVNIKTGKLDANAAVEGGAYPFFTCSREIYAIDTYAFDCEAILLAGNNAVGDFNVKHYEGKFNAYQRTYVITVNEKRRVLYRFLYFQMLKSLKKFKAQSVGAGTKFLKIGMIQGLEIALPSLAEQRSIVSTMDSLREETQRLTRLYSQKLAALEALKKSLLHQAFTGGL
jgi:type I restriction enzyme S subunit